MASNKLETKFVIGAEDTGKATRQKIRNDFKKMGKDVEKVGKSLTKYISGPLAAAATGAAALGASAAKSADDMKKLSTRLGVSTEALSKYKFIADRSNVSFNTLTMSWQRMTRRIAEAARGTGEAKNALRELGLDAGKLNEMSPDKQFETLADALEGVESNSDKVRIAMKLFDSEGVALLQTIEGGSAAMKAQAAIAEKLGIVISDDLATNSADLFNTISVLKNVFVGWGVAIAERVVPPLNNLLKYVTIGLLKFGDWVKDNDKLVMSLTGIGIAIGPATIAIGKLIPVLGLVKTAYKKLGNEALKSWLKALGPATVIAGIIAAVAGSLFVIWANWGDNIQSFFKTLWTNVTSVWNDFSSWFTEATGRALSFILEKWDTFSTAIGDVLRPVFEWAGNAINEVASFVLTGLGKIIQKIGGFAEKLANLTGAEWLKDLSDGLKGAGEDLENFGDKFVLTEAVANGFQNVKDKLMSLGEAGVAFATGPFAEWLQNQPEILEEQWVDMLDAIREKLGLTKEELDGLFGTGEGDKTGDGVTASISQWRDLGAEILNVADIGSQLGGVFDEAFGQLGDAWAEGKRPIMEFGKIFKKVAAGIVTQLIAIIVRTLIALALMSALGGLGVDVNKYKTVTKLINGLAGFDITGEKALGGPVTAGQTYLVGERGPELFTPSSAGNITSAGQTANGVGRGGSQNVTINISADGNIFTDPIAARKIAKTINNELEKINETYYSDTEVNYGIA